MNESTFSIAGQVALLTGATGWIGADLAATFGRAGARVGVAGRRMDAAGAVVQRIRADGGEATAIRLGSTSTAGASTTTPSSGLWRA